MDFGYRGNATVTGHIYIDTNGNGTQGGGEPNIASLNVTVTDSSGHLQTTTTDANGNWSALVIAGSTVAKIDQSSPQYPTGYTQTQGTDPTTVVAVANSYVSAGNDGFFLPGGISGTVLADTNNDGVGDTPLVGVTVTLKDSLGNDIDSDPVAPGVQPTVALTLANGSYSFAGLAPGDYQVVETNPSGYASLTPDQVAVSVTAGGSGVANFVEFGSSAEPW